MSDPVYHTASGYRKYVCQCTVMFAVILLPLPSLSVLSLSVFCLYFSLFLLIRNVPVYFKCTRVFVVLRIYERIYMRFDACM